MNTLIKLLNSRINSYFSHHPNPFEKKSHKTDSKSSQRTQIISSGEKNDKLYSRIPSELDYLYKSEAGTHIKVTKNSLLLQSNESVEPNNNEVVQLTTQLNELSSTHSSFQYSDSILQTPCPQNITNFFPQITNPDLTNKPIDDSIPFFTSEALEACASTSVSPITSPLNEYISSSSAYNPFHSSVSTSNKYLPLFRTPLPAATNVNISQESKSEEEIASIFSNSSDLNSLECQAPSYVDSIVSTSLNLQPPSKYLGSDKDVPDFQVIPYIIRGYRLNRNNFWKCLASVFHLHNETYNIWTHLVGFVVIVCYGLSFLFADNTFLEIYRVLGFVGVFYDRLFLSVFGLLFSSCACMLTSSLYHIFSCCEFKYHKLCLQIDLTGISLLISWSLFAGANLGFVQSPILQNIYLIQSICLFILLVPFPLIQLYYQTKHTHLFTIISIVASFSGIIPFIHYFILFPLYSFNSFGLHLLLMSLFYIVGILFYITAFPEKFLPGKFDIIGNSHQFWHIFVFMAAFTWVDGCCSAYKYHTCNTINSTPA